MMRRLLGTLLLGIPGMLSAQQADSVIPLDRVVAVVGDKGLILHSALMTRFMGQLGPNPMPDSATMRKQLNEILQDLIDVELLMFVASAENITIPEEELERALDRDIAMLKANNFGGNEEAFQAALRQGNFPNVEALKVFRADQVRRQLMPGKVVAHLQEQGRIPSVTVPDSVVDVEIAARRASLPPKQATVSFKQFFMPTQPTEKAKQAARARAESLLVVLQKGADFDSLAKAASMDSMTAPNGGDLGPRGRGKYVAEFDRWAFSLDPGRFSPVVETAFGYHIIKVYRKEPAQVWARHILIRAAIDSADIATTRLRADSAVVRLRAGESFDAIADRYGDPTLNSQRVVPAWERRSLPAEYEAAFKDLKAGAVTDPFVTTDSRRPEIPTYVIATITELSEGGDYTVEELRTNFRRGLENEAAIRKYLDKARTQIYVRIMF